MSMLNFEIILFLRTVNKLFPLSEFSDLYIYFFIVLSFRGIVNRPHFHFMRKYHSFLFELASQY